MLDLKTEILEGFTVFFIVFFFQNYCKKISGFDLFFENSVVKIYPFATLCWVNKDENT